MTAGDNKSKAQSISRPLIDIENIRPLSGLHCGYIKRVTLWSHKRSLHKAALTSTHKNNRII